MQMETTTKKTLSYSKILLMSMESISVFINLANTETRPSFRLQEQLFLIHLPLEVCPNR